MKEIIMIGYCKHMTSLTTKSALLWLWLSRSAVRIQSPAKIVLNIAYCQLYWKECFISALHSYTMLKFVYDINTNRALYYSTY